MLCCYVIMVSTGNGMEFLSKFFDIYSLFSFVYTLSGICLPLTAMNIPLSPSITLFSFTPDSKHTFSTNHSHHSLPIIDHLWTDFTVTQPDHWLSVSVLFLLHFLLVSHLFRYIFYSAIFVLVFFIYIYFSALVYFLVYVSHLFFVLVISTLD